MAIGGFNGSDPSPDARPVPGSTSRTGGSTTSSAAGGVAGGGRGGRRGGSGPPSQITTWVEATFTAKTVGGVTVYDLTAPNS